MNNYAKYLLKTYCVFKTYNEYNHKLLCLNNYHNKNKINDINKWLVYCNLINYMLSIIPQKYKKIIEDVFVKQDYKNCKMQFNFYINKEIIEAIKVFWTYES